MILRSVVAITVLLSGTAMSRDFNENIDEYLEHGDTVKTEIKKEQPEAALIVNTITKMLQLTPDILTKFSEKHPGCKDQLDALVNLFPEIDTMTPQEIRINIERGDRLPSAEGCYAARDVIAHPAIVRALAKDGIQANEQRRMLLELAEAIEHMEEIKQELN